MITKIEIDRILDFYDVPQLFLGRDIIGTRYLCLLYDDNECCKYIAVRISINKLRAFFAKDFDLRSLLVVPEINDDYYIVSYYDDFYHIEKYISCGTLPEAMLPEEGYFF